MRKIASFLLMLALVVPAWGSAEPVIGQQVLYVGGTVPGLKEGTMGRLDTTQEEALVFEAGENKTTIPYAEIRHFKYEEKLARHLGVIATVAVVLVKHRQRRHFVEINYQTKDGTAQVAIFEVSKDNAQVLDAVLRVRTERTGQSSSVDCTRYPEARPCTTAVARSSN